MHSKDGNIKLKFKKHNRIIIIINILSNIWSYHALLWWDQCIYLALHVLAALLVLQYSLVLSIHLVQSSTRQLLHLMPTSHMQLLCACCDQFNSRNLTTAHAFNSIGNNFIASTFKQNMFTTTCEQLKKHIYYCGRWQYYDVEMFDPLPHMLYF